MRKDWIRRECHHKAVPGGPCGVGRGGSFDVLAPISCRGDGLPFPALVDDPGHAPPQLGVGAGLAIRRVVVDARGGEEGES